MVGGLLPGAARRAPGGLVKAEPGADAGPGAARRRRLIVDMADSAGRCAGRLAGGQGLDRRMRLAPGDSVPTAVPAMATRTQGPSARMIHMLTPRLHMVRSCSWACCSSVTMAALAYQGTADGADSRNHHPVGCCHRLRHAQDAKLRDDSRRRSPSTYSSVRNRTVRPTPPRLSASPRSVDVGDAQASNIKIGPVDGVSIACPRPRTPIRLPSRSTFRRLKAASAADHRRSQAAGGTAVVRPNGSFAPGAWRPGPGRRRPHRLLQRSRFSLAQRRL